MGYMGILFYPRPYSIYLRGTTGCRVTQALNPLDSQILAAHFTRFLGFGITGLGPLGSLGSSASSGSFSLGAKVGRGLRVQGLRSLGFKGIGFGA